VEGGLSTLIRTPRPDINAINNLPLNQRDNLLPTFQLGERYAREIMVENTSRFPGYSLKVGEFTDIPGYQNERFLNLKSEKPAAGQRL